VIGSVMQIVLSAAKWTEQNQLLIYQFGRALTSEEQNIALLVGVSKPERVHICEVPEIKRPQEPELAAL